ncbi:hypothetical protein [Sphingomonas mesophila]|uniref:hypothetical protein n=1 Tax=Sphingomonas mesophila TaxID=2303576 RepID=UPI0013C2AD1A|nr:hypothetical protein [Sphingomonas mesophila]
MPEDLYRKPGAVLLSGINTLRPAQVYIMGLNPGGDPATIPAPLIDFIAPPNGTSAYTHECWQPRCEEQQPCSHLSANGLTRVDCLVRHQRNMVALAATLGETPATLFSANAVFARSTSKATLKAQTGFGMWEWWNACWPIHQHFLSIVRPRLIITLGYGESSSAFGLLRAQANSPTPTQFVDEGRRGGWCFEAKLPTADGVLQTSVVGVPHPSYFAPGPKLSQRLAEFVRA